jgi:hypothetical protein
MKSLLLCFAAVAALSTASSDTHPSMPDLTFSTFSSSEQALLGCSHSEDCIFGSTYAIFDSLESKEDMREVKQTAMQESVAAVVVGDDNVGGEAGLIKGRFASKPAFVQHRK